MTKHKNNPQHVVIGWYCSGIWYYRLCNRLPANTACNDWDYVRQQLLVEQCCDFRFEMGSIQSRQVDMQEVGTVPIILINPKHCKTNHA
jgi:hypothetical protein